MTYLGNSPSTTTVLRLEARKSFSLGLKIMDFLDRPLDISGTDIRIVMRKKYSTDDVDDSENLLASSTAYIVDAALGYARFDIQASELDHVPGEYLFGIIMVSNGYSSLIVEGIIEISPNTEFTSMLDIFTPGVAPVTMLDVVLKEQTAISVYAGQALAPGTATFTTTYESQLTQLWADGWNVLANKPILGSAAYVDVEDIALPPGGSPTAALVKASGADFDTHWAQIAVGGTGLDATGQPAGVVPTASGVDTWDWAPNPPPPVTSVNGDVGDVVLTSDDVAEGTANKYVTPTQEAILAEFSNPPAYTDLVGLPVLGTASTHAHTEYLSSSAQISNTIIPKVFSLRGITRGTAAPSGGADGDIYFQYS